MAEEREMPVLASRGVPIEVINPQPQIRRNAETGEWKYGAELAYLYAKAVVFRERLLDPIARIDRGQLPDPIIGVDNLENYKILAEYLLGRDPVGLTFRINFNKEHYIERDGQMEWRFGRWAQLETLLHEYLHGWQETVGFGKYQYKRGRSPHNKEFTQKAESLGLHVYPHFGFHYAVADEPFSLLMKEWGIQRPEDVPKLDEKRDWFKRGGELKGRSSLTKWTCPECGVNARMGIRGNPGLVHDPCSVKRGEKVFFVSGSGQQDVYRPPTNNARLVVEAYQTLINIAAKDREASNDERLDRIEGKAEERLFRRLDKLSQVNY